MPAKHLNGTQAVDGGIPPNAVPLIPWTRAGDREWIAESVANRAIAEWVMAPSPMGESAFALRPRDPETIDRISQLRETTNDEGMQIEQMCLIVDPDVVPTAGSIAVIQQGDQVDITEVADGDNAWTDAIGTVTMIIHRSATPV